MTQSTGTWLLAMAIGLVLGMIVSSCTANAQVTCQTTPYGTTMCSNGAIIFGPPPTPQQPHGYGSGFLGGLDSGMAALESQRRQELMMEQQRLLEMYRKRLERDQQTIIDSY